MRKEEERSTEASEVIKPDIHNEQTSPFSDPCFTDITEQMLGKSIAIVGAPPPHKRS